MRCNQVNLSIERFGKYVPENYPADVQRIHIYCDDFNSIYAALSKAYALAINELEEYENIGCRTDVYTNEFSRSDYREMHAATGRCKRKYEDDVNLQYYDTDIQLCEDRIWVYENSERILAVLKECNTVENMTVKLKEAFGLNDYQIRKLAQMRFDMLTKEEYEETKKKLEIKKASITNKERAEMYSDVKKKKVQKDISKLNTYFTLVAHYEDVIKIMMEAESSREMEDALREKFNLSIEQAKEVKYFSLNDFSKEEQLLRKKELERLKEWEKYNCLN